MNYYDGSEFPQDAKRLRLSDMPYIQTQIRRLPPGHRNKAMEAYSKAYKEILDDESIPTHQRVCKARRDCNIRLIAYVDNIININKPEMK